MKRGAEISGGTLRGRKLRIPQGIRPTQGIVKRSVFDRLGPLVYGSRFLELFAGSGAVGIEALSRGAREVWFVEKSGRGVRTLRANLKALGLEDRATVIHGDALKVVASLVQQGQVFDLIFADPPYHFERYTDLLKHCRHLLVPDEGLLILEMRKTTAPAPVPGLETLKEVVLGDTKVTFYRRVSGEL